MTLGSMRRLGVHQLIAYCFKPVMPPRGSHQRLQISGRHWGAVVCQESRVCEVARGQNIDVRPNWKEQSLRPSLTGKVWRR
jgi:hypothetical protein